MRNLRRSPGRPCTPGTITSAAGNGKARQRVAVVDGGDPSFENDGGLRCPQQRQARLSLKLGKRTGGDDPALIEQHKMVRQPLDLRHIMADIEDRDRQRPMKRFEIRQDVVLCRPVERRERLIHQQEARL